jgi:hypothetical protein
MVWVRLDDDFSENPKVIAAGPLAQTVYVNALCYANRNLTDGFIPSAMTGRLICLEGPEQSVVPLVARLVSVGLWEEAEGGYRIHDYLEYNPGRAEVLAEREAAKQRRTHRQSDASAETGLAERNANVARTSRERVENVNPPVPVPDPVLHTTTARASAAEPDPQTAALFTAIEAAGVNIGGQMQAEGWLELLELTSDMGLIRKALQNAVDNGKRPTPRYVHSILERCLRDGCDPGEFAVGAHTPHVLPTLPRNPNPKQSAHTTLTARCSSRSITKPARYAT